MRTVLAAPFVIVLVLFALSNTQTVRLSLWPTDFAVDTPLSIAILAAMAVAFLLGGLMLWLSGIATRRRARRAEYKTRLLEEQNRELKSKLPGTTMVSRP
jgi:uncharacterized integral membrane protein